MSGSEKRILRERQLKLEKLNATRRYIEEFKEQQYTWRKMEKEKMEEENRKILAFANMQQRREEDRMAQVREQEEKKKALQDMLAGHIQKELQQREELEQMRQELYLEEQAEEARQREIAEMEKKIRQRLELQRTFEEQMAFKQIVQQAAKEEEEAFRQAMLAKFAEDDRIEQMNAQKRRMKQLEHKRAVEKLLEDRRKQFIADKDRELQERHEEEKREAFRRAIIERRDRNFSSNMPHSYWDICQKTSQVFMPQHPAQAGTKVLLTAVVCMPKAGFTFADEGFSEDCVVPPLSPAHCRASSLSSAYIGMRPAYPIFNIGVKTTHAEASAYIRMACIPNVKDGGIFKNEEDLGMFDEEFRKIFQKRSTDLFSDEGWDS
ncbi:unnamed protein product [Ranitomeya imitator]|uniref:Meiosis-specific nuclear structural protein 1 n=1 Tax=Ranitomeya imitator TaxID=111125 RepID=A0ABN9L3Q1_9NEOB|nr:unnamed protein product [Ranitomeya imitator]